MTKQLLVVYHSAGGSTARLVEAALAGARDPDVDGVETRSVAALTAGADAVRATDGILLATPENFGYMSGALKYFFDGIYYDCLEHTQGLPFAVLIKAGTDGQGALGAIRRITTGLRWREVCPPVVVVGTIGSAQLAAARELGLTLAAGLEAGVF